MGRVSQSVRGILGTGVAKPNIEGSIPPAGQFIMGYREFEKGDPVNRLEQWKRQEARERTVREMTSRWRESERVLGILRSVGSVSDSSEGVESWFEEVKHVPLPENPTFDSPAWTANQWFSARFPEVRERFGAPFFEELTHAPAASSLICPTVLNEDFLAAMLGGEKHLGHRMVYLPGEGFLFRDPRVNAFVKTSDAKVEILLSNYLLKCAENMPRNVNAKLLFKDHRRPSILSSVVARAKVILEADMNFFTGKRVQLSNQLGAGPAGIPSPERFVQTAFAQQEGATLVVREAYQEFLRYCEGENWIRMDYTEFKKAARAVVMKKFQLGLRHDIRTPEGHQTHGWKHLRLVQNPGEGRGAVD